MEEASKEGEVTIFVTKYALTAGIKRRKAVILNSGAAMARDRNGYVCYRPIEFRLREAEAIARAEEMRLGEIVNLKKRLTKLEAMTFTIDAIR